LKYQSVRNVGTAEKTLRFPQSAVFRSALYFIEALRIRGATALNGIQGKFGVPERWQQNRRDTGSKTAVPEMRRFEAGSPFARAR
jgi:hypothetical protein